MRVMKSKEDAEMRKAITTVLYTCFVLFPFFGKQCQNFNLSKNYT